MTPNNSYFDSEFPLDLQFKKKKFRYNMKMFNFSKVMEETEPRPLISSNNKRERFTFKKEEENHKRSLTK